MIGLQIGNYRIVEKLGEGGMGVVYKGVDVNLERPVAIKVLGSDLARNPQLGERFKAEAKAQANLNHTNLATLYAFLTQDDIAVMVMEYVDGETFDQMIQRRGPIPSQEVIPLFKQALLGIGVAHRMGIIHRDIKPSNLMLRRDGIVKVMDFGIAKLMGTRGLTRTGTQMGTVAYMSPEQVQNRAVDIRSDIYALGVTLYEMLSGHLPFESDSDFQIMHDHVSTPPPLPTRHYPYIPKGVENVVLRALEKNPDARFQTVEEFGVALEHPETVPAPQETGPGQLRATVLEGAVPPALLAGAATFPATGPQGAGVAGRQDADQPLPQKPGRLSSLLAGKSRLVAAAGGVVVLLVAVVVYVLWPKPVPPPTPRPAGQLTPSSGAGTQGASTQGASDVVVARGGGKIGGGQGAGKERAETGRGKQGRTPLAKVERVTIPSGRVVSVRMIAGIDSQSASPGQTFAAIVTSPIVVSGTVVVRQGAEAAVQLFSARASGRKKGSELGVRLVSLAVGGTKYDVMSEPNNEEGKGILGKSKSAFKDAFNRARAGVASQFVTHGKQVRIPADSKLDFKLSSPLSITIDR